MGFVNVTWNTEMRRHVEVKAADERAKSSVHAAT